MTLPPPLATALDALLDGVSRRDLAARASAMSAAYRAEGTSGGIAAPLDALAYAVARMPATYAACAAVFAQVARVLPLFAPAGLLDVGAGTGAASWAAMQAWPGIGQATLLDHNPALRDLARRLAQAGPPALAGAQIAAGDLRSDRAGADLVMASYVLAEQPQSQAAEIAVKLWGQASQALVLIEPGTPDGFARIRAARAALIAAGAHVAAPCTHDKACPMPRSEGERRSDDQTTPDWCHFSQRLARSRDHMQLKGAQVPFEDERYAYVVVTRAPMAHHAAARILSPPLVEKAAITLKLCDAEGLRLKQVPRRDADAWRVVRRKDWGDLV